MTKIKQKADFTSQTIQLGMDVHLNKWNVAIFFTSRLHSHYSTTVATIGTVDAFKKQLPWG